MMKWIVFAVLLTSSSIWCMEEKSHFLIQDKSELEQLTTYAAFCQLNNLNPYTGNVCAPTPFIVSRHSGIEEKSSCSHCIVAQQKHDTLAHRSASLICNLEKQSRAMSHVAVTEQARNTELNQQLSTLRQRQLNSCVQLSLIAAAGFGFSALVHCLLVYNQSNNPT